MLVGFNITDYIKHLQKHRAQEYDEVLQVTKAKKGVSEQQTLFEAMKKKKIPPDCKKCGIDCGGWPIHFYG